MQYARLGDHEVSRLCVGGFNFGVTVDAAGVREIIAVAEDHGVNLIDTAESYGNGRSEEFIGAALQNRRDRFFLATKIYRSVAADGKAARNSRANILQSVDDSLTRLRTDCIDLLQLHHPDPETPWRESFEALAVLARAGKVRHVGICNHYGWQIGYLLGQLRNATGLPAISSLQHGYSLLERAVELEIVPLCRKFSVPFLGYEPLAQGVLSGRYHGDHADVPTSLRQNDRVRGYLESREIGRLLQDFQSVAREQRLSLSQLSILWLMSKSWLTSAILGVDNSEHLRTACGTLDRRLPGDVVAELDRLSEARMHVPFINQPMIDGFAVDD